MEVRQSKRLLILGAYGKCVGPATRDLLARSNEWRHITLAGSDEKKLDALRHSFAPEASNITVKTFCIKYRDECPAAKYLPYMQRLEHVEYATVELLRGLLMDCDLVLNGLPYDVGTCIAQLCIELKKPGVDLCTGRDAQEYHNEAVKAGVLYVNGCGATPGLTNMLAAVCCEELKTVLTIDISFAAFRALALSPGLVDVVLWEFDPANDEIAYYKDGKLIQVPPMSDPKDVDFGYPIHLQTVYRVPHEETLFLGHSLGASEVNVRGCFPPPAMDFVKGALHTGMITKEPVTINGVTTSPWAVLCNMMPQISKARETPFFHYGLRATVHGLNKSSEPVSLEAWTKTPTEDVWGVPGAYLNVVGLPLAIATELLAEGEFSGVGIVGPESCFETKLFWERCKARNIEICTSWKKSSMENKTQP